MKLSILPLILIFTASLCYGQCPTSIVAISSSKIQINFSTGDACSSGDPIGYLALEVSGFSGYRSYWAGLSQLTNTSTTSLTIEDLDDYWQNSTGNTTAWTSSDVATRIRTEDINFDDCNVCNTSYALPITLVTFYGKNQKNKTELFWETASEINNEKFEIERSLNSFDFEKIGEIKGSGNSNENVRYSFDDLNTQGLPEKVYYRLKQIDFDGKHQYSNIVLVKKMYNPYEDISVKYNSSTQIVRVSLNNPEFASYGIGIYDLNGEQVIQANTEATYLDISTSDLAKGMYIVRVESAEQPGAKFQKIVIQ